MSEIQTPETDEVLRRNAESDQTPQEDYEILADHAANLEYRLAESREQIAELETRHAATILHTQAVVDDANSLREQRDRLAEALTVAMARAYASGYQHGHEDTVEAQFIPVHHTDTKDYFADNVRQMMIDGSQPEADSALAAVKGVPQ